MMSKIPPVSPASIMFVVRSSKTLGYSRIALARVAPPSTVVRTPVSVFWKAVFSWFAARISRHCTNGRPASIMTENWRKKTAISLVLTLLDPNMGSANSLPFSRIVGPAICSRRSCKASTCLLAATRSPVIFSPAVFFPENVKTGMGPSLFTTFYLELWLLSCSNSVLAGRCAFCGHSAGLSSYQACATVDHFLQFVLVAGARHRNFHRDLLLEIKRRQRLIEGLHSVLVLSRLHSRIDLV